jgi:hypothetical protein
MLAQRSLQNGRQRLPAEYNDGPWHRGQGT